MAAYEWARPSLLQSTACRPFELRRSPRTASFSAGLPACWRRTSTTTPSWPRSRRARTTRAGSCARRRPSSVADIISSTRRMVGTRVNGRFPIRNAARSPREVLGAGKRMFAADIADWRPNGGSTCEQAVLIAACRSGDAFVELAARDGGHFGAGGLARKLGIDVFAFPMLDDLIDVERTVALIEQHPRIRLALLQPSHGRRPQPIEALAAALPQRVTIAVDVSHTAGLIAGGLLPQPLMHGAHILTFNTHKTLPGPNKGVIAFADRNHPLAETVWDVVCPQLQSNSHPECLPGLVIALEEVATFGRAYAQQMVRTRGRSRGCSIATACASLVWSMAVPKRTRFT